MARTQKNFSVLGDSISTFQGYSPWGAAHYSPDLGAATGVHTVEDTWWMQVIRALQGRLLPISPSPAIPSPLRAPWADFPRVELHSLPSMASRQTTSFSMPGSNDANFYVPPEGFLREYQQLPPVFGKPIPTHRSAAALILGAVPGTQGSSPVLCSVWPLQPGHPLCRGAGRLSAGGLGRYAFLP